MSPWADHVLKIGNPLTTATLEDQYYYTLSIARCMEGFRVSKKNIKILMLHLMMSKQHGNLTWWRQFNLISGKAIGQCKAAWLIITNNSYAKLTHIKHKYVNLLQKKTTWQAFCTYKFLGQLCLFFLERSLIPKKKWWGAPIKHGVAFFSIIPIQWES